MMDRKERKAGDPFGGAPMKRFEGESQLPKPPDVSELVKVEVERKPAEDQDELRCPCGKLYEDCVGNLFYSRDEIFNIMKKLKEQGG